MLDDRGAGANAPHPPRDEAAGGGGYSVPAQITYAWMDVAPVVALFS
jgi:hypothetical protein